MGRNVQNELWASLLASILANRRALEFILQSDTKKSKNWLFLAFWQTIEILLLVYCNIYPGYHHVKADVLKLTNMRNLLGFRVSERELLLFDPIPPSLIQYGASNLFFGRFKPLCVTHILKDEAEFFHLVLSWTRSYYVNNFEKFTF